MNKADTCRHGTLEHKLTFSLGLTIGNHGAILKRGGQIIPCVVSIGRKGSYPRLICVQKGRLLQYQVRADLLLPERSFSMSSPIYDDFNSLVASATQIIDVTPKQEAGDAK